MNHWIFLFTIITIIVSITSTSKPVEAAWLNSSFSMCMNFWTNSSVVNGDINGGLVLPVILDNRTGIYNGSYGWADIRFSNQSCSGTGGIYLPYQVELVNSTVAIFHVNFNSLLNDTDVNYSVYWDNPTAVTASNNPNPYSTNHIGVFHMNDSGKDSSTYNFNGTPSGSTSSSSGIIGGAEYFNSGYYDFGDLNQYDGLTDLTIMAWMFVTETSNKHFISKTNGASTDGWTLARESTDCVFAADVGGSFKSNIRAPCSLDLWNHVAGTYDGNYLKIYINGELKDIDGPYASAIEDAASDSVYIGKATWDATTMIGHLDEIIVLNRTMQYYEIDAKYQSDSERMFIFGSTESTSNAPPMMTQPTIVTAGGRTGLNLIYGETIMQINVTVTDSDGNEMITSVNISLKDPDDIYVITNSSMVNTTYGIPTWTYPYAIIPNKAGIWTIETYATDGTYFAINSTTFYISTQNISTRSGWYGYTNQKILNSTEISNLMAYGYDILEIEENATSLQNNWTLILNSMNDTFNLNVRNGLNIRLNINYSNDTQINDIDQFIASNFDTLLNDPYSDSLEYISLSYVAGGSHTDASIANAFNKIAQNITAATSNKFAIFAKYYGSPLLDPSYIIPSPLPYVIDNNPVSLINTETSLLRRNSTLSRIYQGINDSMKAIAKDIHDKAISKLRGIPALIALKQSECAKINSVVSDLVVFNNQSSSRMIVVNVSEMTSSLGKDAWDTTTKYLIEKSTDLNFSVSVSGYSATYVLIDNIDHIQMDLLTLGNVFKASGVADRNFSYTNKSDTTSYDGAFGLNGAQDVRIEMFDPHYAHNRFITYYGWWNSSTIDNWSMYDIIIFADHNKVELGKVLSATNTTNLYCYVSVADYANTDIWENSKKSQIDECIGLNASTRVNAFLDGLDIGVGGTNFSARMKDLIDYVKYTKLRKVGLNTYTAYEQFCAWSRPDGFCMKESCVNRWNGISPSTPTSYSRESWSLEMNKSAWYSSHGVTVVCQAFDNRTTDNTALLNWTEVQNIYFASKVLGYRYFYLSQPDFNYAWDIYAPDVGDDLSSIYTTTDNIVYSRTFSKGIVYYNSSSHHGWFVDGREILNATMCVKLVDNSDVNEGTNLECSINDGGFNYIFTATEVTWSANGIWYCKDMLTNDISTSGHYDVKCEPTNRLSLPADAMFFLYDETSGLMGGHSWWDAAGGGYPYTWNYYQNDRNWLVRINIKQRSKAAIDTTDKIIQTNVNDSSTYNVTLSSAYPFNIDIWTNPVHVNGAGFIGLRYKNSTGYWINLNTTGTFSCDSNNPTFQNTTIEGNIHKACLDLTAMSPSFRISAPSLSAREYQYLSDYTPPTMTISYPSNGTVIYTNCSRYMTISGIAYDLNGVDTVKANDTRFGYNQGSSTNWIFRNASLGCGKYDVLITANDTADNVANMQVHFDIIQDVIPPAIIVTYPSNGTIYTNCSSNISIYGTATDINGVDKVTINSSYWGNNHGISPNWIFTNYTASCGNYHIIIRANDTYGNTAQKEIRFTISAPPPTPPAPVPTGIPLVSGNFLALLMASGGIFMFAAIVLTSNMDMRKMTYGLIFLIIILTLAVQLSTI